jgi:ComF family protein
MNSLRTFKNFFLDLLFPRQCLSCKKADTWLCEACFSYVKPNIHQVCYLCRRTSEKAKTCNIHTSDDPARQLDRLLVAAHYSGNPIIKKSIHTLKYANKPEDIANKLGRFLSETLALHLSIFHVPHCVFIPIPLHPKRLKSRGYNQAELITKSMREAFNHPLIIDHQLLTRSKHTSSQVSSSTRKARLENLKEAFQINGKTDPAKIYILVDDVVTTGSTLEECCKILKEDGAREVWGLVLARN